MATIDEKDTSHNDEFKEISSEQSSSVVSEYASSADIEPKLHLRTWMVLLACTVIYMGTVFGIVASGFWLVPALHKVGGTVPGTGLWFFEGSFVIQVALTPAFGLMSDFSPLIRKRVTMGLTFFGAIGLFVSGSAQHLMPQSVLGNCLYGLSKIALAPSSAIVADIFPRRTRGVAQGLLFSFGAALGAFVCAVGGGGLIKHVSNNNGWRWNFYIAGILELCGCILLFIFYNPLSLDKEQERKSSYLQHMILDFDWMGNFLYCAAMIPVMLALIWGGANYPWSSTPCIATITIGCGFLVVFIFHQVYVRKDGIFNHKLFRNRNFSLGLMAIFIEGLTLSTWNVYLAQQIGKLYTSDPVMLGLHLGVFHLSSAVACIGWGLYSKRYQEVKLPLISGFAGMIAASAGLSQLRPMDQTDSQAAWGLCALVGFSYGGPQGIILTIIQLTVSPDLTGIATSLAIAIRSLGGALGPAIGNTIFSSKISAYLPRYIAQYSLRAGVSTGLLPDVIKAIAKGGTQVVQLPEITNEQLKAAKTGYLLAYADSFAYINYSLIPWTAIAVLLLFGLKSVKKDMSWQIDRPVEEDLLKRSNEAQGQSERA